MMNPEFESTAELQKKGVYGGKVNDAYSGSVDDTNDGKFGFGGDENEERGNWSGKLDFIMACLSCAVGLGNVWRFPYLCYQNGGGAFFIPYIIMMLFVGLPVFFLELSIGQFSSSGPLTCFRFSPIFSGIGVAMVMAAGLVAMYYNVIISWAIYYLIRSFTDLPYLPWEHCDPAWATWLCEENLPDMACNETELLWRNDTGVCRNATTNTIMGIWNETMAKENGIVRQSSAQQFFNYRLLNLTASDSINSIGSLRWELCLCLLGAWVMVCLCLIKGIKSSGKVVYFTALFPYAVLLALLINGLTLPGMADGIKYYVTPEWDRLLNARVWVDAAVQIFFSLSIGFGGLVTLASYNRFHTNTLRDACIVTFGNCATSVFAGFAIFAYLGHMAHKLHTTVDKVATGGVGLAFVVYPQSVLTLPFPPIWSMLFFTMLLTLGLGSQFALVETVTTSINDRFPQLRPKKSYVIITVSILFYLIGLSMCTDGGAYVLTLFDAYSGSWAVLLIGIFECIAVTWVYGFSRFRQDIKIMIGFDPSIWWAICWTALSPALMTVIMVFGWIDFSPLKYDGEFMPSWTNYVGVSMVILVALATPVMGVYRVIRSPIPGNCWQKFKFAFKPKWNWGPALEKHRRLVTYVPGFVLDINSPEERMKHQESSWDLEGLHAYNQSQFPTTVEVKDYSRTQESHNRAFDHIE